MLGCCTSCHPAENIRDQSAARKGLPQLKQQASDVCLAQIHQQPLRNHQYRSACSHDLLQQIQVVPFNFTVVHPPKASVQSAAQVQNHPTRVIGQERAHNGIQFLCPLTDQYDCLVGHTQPGEIVFHLVEDLPGFGIEKQGVTRLSFCVKCDQQGFLFGS